MYRYSTRINMTGNMAFNFDFQRHTYAYCTKSTDCLKKAPFNNYTLSNPFACSYLAGVFS